MLLAWVIIGLSAFQNSSTYGAILLFILLIGFILIAKIQLDYLNTFYKMLGSKLPADVDHLIRDELISIINQQNIELDQTVKEDLENGPLTLKFVFHTVKLIEVDMEP